MPMSDTMACVMDDRQDWFAPLTSMFLHGGWLHLIGNMWFLWLFGNNVEDSQGHVRYLVFYLLCGLAAAAAQTLVNPIECDSNGGRVGCDQRCDGCLYRAVSQGAGAHADLPRLLHHPVVVPAYVMLGYWFLIQILGGLPTIGDEEGGVAFWAHAGGFIAGAILIQIFKDPELVAKHRAMARTMEHGLVYRER